MKNSCSCLASCQALQITARSTQCFLQTNHIQRAQWFLLFLGTQRLPLGFNTFGALTGGGRDKRGGREITITFITFLAMFGLYFEFVLCRALFLIITIINFAAVAVFFFFFFFFAGLHDFRIFGEQLHQKWRKIHSVATYLCSAGKNTSQSFCRMYQLLPLLHYISRWSKAYFCLRLHFFHGALLITEWQPCLALVFLLEAKFDIV